MNKVYRLIEKAFSEGYEYAYAEKYFAEDEDDENKSRAGLHAGIGAGVGLAATSPVLYKAHQNFQNAVSAAQGAAQGKEDAAKKTSGWRGWFKSKDKKEKIVNSANGASFGAKRKVVAAKQNLKRMGKFALGTAAATGLVAGGYSKLFEKKAPKTKQEEN